MGGEGEGSVRFEMMPGVYMYAEIQSTFSRMRDKLSLIGIQTPL